jgi:hypothetical protein
MEFKDIKETDLVAEGEYVLHTPSKTIVLCGTFSREENVIRGLKSGRYMEDEISNFQKIEMPRAEAYRTKATKAGCGSCKKHL